MKVGIDPATGKACHRKPFPPAIIEEEGKQEEKVEISTELTSAEMLSSQPVIEYTEQYDEVAPSPGFVLVEPAKADKLDAAPPSRKRAKIGKSHGSFSSTK